MSPAFPIDQDESGRHRHRSSIWVNPVDAKGTSVDERFIDAAYDKADDLMRYRANELRDEALRLNLIERAVHRASRAKKREPVRDFAGYVYSVFTRLVDVEVSRERRLVLVDADCLEDFAARNGENSDDIDDDIQQDQILGAMDESTRLAWSRRLSGYEVQEIAAELNITPDCLSTRMRRGLRAATAKLFRHRSK
jgi:DNA-directed RNA polymerase specialized sigma24 family protein